MERPRTARLPPRLCDVDQGHAHAGAPAAGADGGDRRLNQLSSPSSAATSTVGASAAAKSVMSPAAGTGSPPRSVPGAGSGGVVPVPSSRSGAPASGAGADRSGAGAPRSGAAASGAGAGVAPVTSSPSTTSPAGAEAASGVTAPSGVVAASGVTA